MDDVALFGEYAAPAAVAAVGANGPLKGEPADPAAAVVGSNEACLRSDPVAERSRAIGACGPSGGVAFEPEGGRPWTWMSPPAGFTPLAPLLPPLQRPDLGTFLGLLLLEFWPPLAMCAFDWLQVASPPPPPPSARSSGLREMDSRS